MDRNTPTTRLVFFRVGVIALALAAQWVLPWVHLAVDHAGAVQVCQASVEGAASADHSHPTQSHHASDCSVCHWVRSGAQGVTDSFVAFVPADVRAVEGVVSFGTPGARGLCSAAPRAPPVVG